jgi:MFS transporter, AAHS family, 4-hydroxybenzoate transporter
MSTTGQINSTYVGAMIDAAPISWLQARVILLCCLLMSVDGYDMQVASYVAPALVHDWGIDKTAFGAIFGVAQAGYLVGATLLGVVGDRVGRRAVICTGLGLFGVATLAAAFAHNIHELFVLRALAGVGLGACIANVLALATEYAPARHQAKTVALLFVCYTGGAALGGLLAASLIANLGWPSAFILGGAAPLILLFVVAALLPESIRYLALDPRNQARVANLIGRIKGATLVSLEPGSPRVPRLPLGRSVLALFQDGNAVPTLILWGGFVTAFIGHFFLTSWVPLLVASRGMSSSVAAISGAFLQAGGALGSAACGMVIDRRGFKTVAVAFLVSVPVVASIGFACVNEAALFAAVFIAGALVLGGQIGLNSFAATMYATPIRSTGTGWAFGVGRLGAIVGSLSATVLLGLGLSADWLFPLGSTPFIVCAACMYALARIRRNRSADV